MPPTGYTSLVDPSTTQQSNTSPATGVLQARAADATIPPALRGAARRRGGGWFLFAVTVVVAVMHTVYVGFLQLPLVREWLQYSSAEQPLQAWVDLFLIATYHIWFALFLTALVQCSTTDPGTVPAHWGFYFGEESKRRRYCRVCNVWKPDRTHHCSSCGRCVLNMDHHCPWINNCVGFFNRKFFLQLLWYGILCLLYVCFHGVYYLGTSAATFWPSDYRPAPLYPSRSPVDYIGYTLVLVVTLFSTILLGALFPFTKFHMGLVIHNSTTIESMDVGCRDSMKYDLGPRRNIEQVFGAAPMLWWVPVHLAASRPVGDGVRWRRHYMRAVDEDEMLMAPHAWENFSVDDDPTDPARPWADGDDSQSYSQASTLRTRPNDDLRSSAGHRSASFDATARRDNARGMRRQQSLPTAWRVHADGSYQGYLFRLKGKWKKQWAKELLVVQHNVLLVCTKEQPFLVKHCIPLVNIQKVEPEPSDNVKFTLTYLAPLKKGKSRVTVMQLRTSNNEERALWINKLVEFQRKALSRDTPIGDFVEKTNVEATLKSVYASLTNTVTLALIGSITKVVSSAQDRNLRYAFQTWRSRLQTQLKMEVKQNAETLQIAVKERTADLNDQLAKAKWSAKKDRALLLAADRLRAYQRQLLHFSLLRLKRNSDIHTTEAMAVGAASLMTFNWRVQAQVLARDANSWRRRRVYGIFMLMRDRRLREAFEKLRVGGLLNAETHQKKIGLLSTFLRRQEELGLAEKRVIWNKWQLYMIHADRKRDALKRCLQEEEQRQTRAALRRWYMTVATKSTYDIVAVTKMETALKLVLHRHISMAFRELYHHMDEENNIQSLQVASNFSMLNSKLVRSFNQIPMHRAAISLTSTLARMHYVRIKRTLMCLKAHSIRMRYMERSAEAFSTMWYSLQKRRFLYQSFYRLSTFASRKHVRDSAKAQKLDALALIFKLKRIELLGAGLLSLRRASLMRSLQLEKEAFLAKYHKVVSRGTMTNMELLAHKMGYWYERLVQRRQAWALRGLECNCERSVMLRSVLRLQVTQRVVQLFDRLRVVRLAAAFEILKLLLAPSIQARMDEKLIAETVVASENLCGRIERRRLRQKIYGLTSTPEEFDDARLWTRLDPAETRDYAERGPKGLAQVMQARKAARRRERSPLKHQVRARQLPQRVNPVRLQRQNLRFRRQPHQSTQWAPSDACPRPVCQPALLPSPFPTEPPTLKDIARSPRRLPSIEMSTRKVLEAADHYLREDSPNFDLIGPMVETATTPSSDETETRIPASPFVEPHSRQTTPLYRNRPGSPTEEISFSFDESCSVDLEELDDILGQLSVVTTDSRTEKPIGQSWTEKSMTKVDDYIDWRRIVDYMREEDLFSH